MSGFSTAGCFLAGTLLLTSQGERSVETLRPGQELVTIREDGPRTRPIVCVTAQRIATRGKALPDRAALVRITAGAFAPEMPARALVGFGDHAVYADGALFELADLRNGTTIYGESAEVVVGYRVTLDAHDVVLAEGLPVESGVLSGPARAARDSKIVALYPEWVPAAREACCLDVVREGAELEALRRMLDYRARDQQKFFGTFFL